MEDNIDIIDYIVQSCIKIMKEHSFAETIYVDYFESNESCLSMTAEEVKSFKEKYNKTPEEIRNIELVIEDNTSDWEEILSEHYMSKDDFICNIILLTLLEICYDIKIKYNDKSKCSASKLNDKYYKYIWDNGDIPDRKRIKRRETAVLETKLLHYDADELKNNNLKNSSILGKLQERLVFHEIICGNTGKERNPLIKLANSPSLSTHHFDTDALNTITDYYKDIIYYINDNINNEFETLMLIYSLEIELRLYTYMSFMNSISEVKFKKSQTDALERIRGLFDAKRIVFRNGVKIEYEYQNIIYFGMEKYIEKVSNECKELQKYEIKIKHLEDTLNKMYSIVCAIDVIKNTIIKDFKKVHGEDYQQYIQKIYIKLKDGFNSQIQNKYVEKILKKNQDMIDKYSNINKLKNINLSHFVQIYHSDNIPEQ